LRSLLALPTIRAALAASIAFYVTIGMFEAVWALLLKDLGADKLLIGLTLSFFTVPMIFLAPTGGRYAQRYGPLRVAGYSIAVATSVHVLLRIPAVVAIADRVGGARDCRFVHDAGQPSGCRDVEPTGTRRGRAGLLGAVGVAVAGTVGISRGRRVRRPRSRVRSSSALRRRWQFSWVGDPQRCEPASTL
jgi:MFS family permease